MDYREEFTPIDCYDFRRARLASALHWLLDAAFDGKTPAELKEPLPLREKDTVSAIYLNTGLVTLLVNSHLYIKACQNLFPKHVSLWQADQGHWSVIQGLSRLGVYVEDDRGQAITEKELVQNNPVHLSAHVGMCECLMKAFLHDTCSIDLIVQAVRLIGPSNASEDLPIDKEDAMLLWLNKVSLACFRHESISRNKILNNNSLVTDNGYPDGVAPQMDDLLKDVCEGTSLCLLISFYCPHLLPFSSICLKEHIGIADSLHNLNLIRTFCDRHLSGRIYTFTHEDIIYGADTIKPSLLAFLTKLLAIFVIKPLDIVRPRVLPISGKDKSKESKRLPSSTAARDSSRRDSGHDLISDKTRQTFSRGDNLHVSGDSDLYSSNPSLNLSPNSSSSSRLLHKRSAQLSSNDKMHDTLSPIMVRKSQSMLSLNAPDTKQSRVAWENKPYYVDRNKSKPVNPSSSNNSSLLANVDLDNEENNRISPEKHHNGLNELRNQSLRGGKDRSGSLNHQQPSDSYKQLLDQGFNLSDNLNQFSTKYNNNKASDSLSRTAPSQSHDSSELTKVTPRSDESPRHSQPHSHNSDSAVGQSYVVSSSYDADIAKAAGIPVIADSVTESVTFASADMDEDLTPIAPIAGFETVQHNGMNGDHHSDVSTSPRTTSFAAMRSRGRDNARESTNLAMSTTGSLKQRFTQNKPSSQSDAKPVKKTTFSLNSTTWSDNAENLRQQRQQVDESDSASETSEPSAQPDRKQLSDVMLRLEEKRKAIEKKKNLEELERKKEMNNASRGAFLQSVSRNKNKSSPRSSKEPLKAFGGFDIAQSLEDLSTKWAKDDKSVKPSPNTTPTKSVNATPNSMLDNITEVSESDPQAFLRDSETSELSSHRDSELSSHRDSELSSRQSISEDNDREVDDIMAPLDINQYGLEVLNQSLNQLKGQMEKLTVEQQKIQTMQATMTAEAKKPVSPSVQPIDSQTEPQHPLKPHPQLQQPIKTSNTSTSPAINNHNESSTVLMSKSLHMSDLENGSVASSDSGSNQIQMSGSAYTPSSDWSFSNPPPSTMTQSSDTPFVLHDKKKTTPKSARSSTTKATPASAPPSSGRMTPSGRRTPSGRQTPSTGGFLSSSQLSRRDSAEKLTTPASQPDTPDASASTRRKWSNNAAPLFPGYEDDTPAQEVAQRLSTPQSIDQPVFAPPRADPRPEYIPPNNVRHANRQPLAIIPIEKNESPTNSPKSTSVSLLTDTMGLTPTCPKSGGISHDSTNDTPMREMRPPPRPNRPSSMSFSLPADMDTPLKEVLMAQQGLTTPGLSSTDTPARVKSSFNPNTSIDTPMRQAIPSQPQARQRMSMNETNQMFYSPEAQLYVHHPVNDLTMDTPAKEFYAGEGRGGNVSSQPHASSRHGTYPIMSTSELDTPAKPNNRGSNSKPYKLQTPYGNADNEISAPSVSLSAALSNLQDSFLMSQASQSELPAACNGSFAHQQPYYTQALASMDSVLANIGYSPPKPELQSHPQLALAVNSSEAPALIGQSDRPSSAQEINPYAGFQAHRPPSAARSASPEAANTDSTASTPRTGRKTWDMSAPKGDVLNNPGVGFIVAEQNTLSEDEIQRRKERVLMMQLKRREDNERKKAEKEAEAAAKRERQRQKDSEVERKKLMEKAKKEAILQEYQVRKQEEELPPEVRHHFRQKMDKRTRPASIHWAGSSITDDNLLGMPDNVETGSSFSNMSSAILSGGLATYRPHSPAAGSSSQRSKAPSRGPLDFPPEEYTGPKLYVKPSQKQKSNRSIIINAISHCCLAGIVNTEPKNRVLEAIAKTDGKHFLILFRDGNQTYKAVYSFCLDTEECCKVYGQGPRAITNDMCHRFYKYNSGGKKFTEVLSTKHLSVSIDAITIQNHLWQKKTAKR